MSPANEVRIKTYSQFFDFYLGEHRLAATRYWHYFGSSLVIVIIIMSIITNNPLFLILAPIAGYGPAWFSHFFIERNKPATFRYPIWSLWADYHMYALFLTGQLKQRMSRANQ